MTAYYNECDERAAQTLRNLIVAGAIAPGWVDTRSIEDVLPSDLEGFTQCHFFAGIGVWSYALRMAGWPDDRAVWSGSCPCQPFSAAGQGAGFDDERHLWPAWFQLVAQRRPNVVFGEQVASNDGLAWLDLVHTDLEGADYSVEAADLCAAGFGAPHIRQRFFFVANTDDCRRSIGQPQWGRAGSALLSGAADRVANCNVPGLEVVGLEPARQERATAERGRAFDGLADGEGIRRHEGRRLVGQWPGSGNDGQPRGMDDSDLRLPNDALSARWHERWGAGGAHRPGPTNGHWRDVDWVSCRDGKWRPVEPGTSPLAYGVANRVGLLRGYGNAIVAQVAAGFIQAYLSAQ